MYVMHTNKNWDLLQYRLIAIAINVSLFKENRSLEYDLRNDYVKFYSRDVFSLLLARLEIEEMEKKIIRKSRHDVTIYISLLFILQRSKCT